MAPKNKAQSKIEAKEAKKAKQASKANKSQLKKDGVTEDVCIEALLKDAIVIEGPMSMDPCSPMGYRNALTGVHHPSNAEIVFFGGELYDGKNIKLYNETYRLRYDVVEMGRNNSGNSPTGVAIEPANEPVNGDDNDDVSSIVLDTLVPEANADKCIDGEETTKSAWLAMSGGLQPPPRCSHTCAIANNNMYLFGGEFNTKEQYMHYNDTWSLDLKTWKWTCMQTIGKTPASRSGAKMVAYRGNLMVFGGFCDNNRVSKYYSDLHVLNLKTQRWTEFNYGQLKSPKPRSNCLFACFDNQQGIFMYGGYHKDKPLCDSWWLDLKPISKGGVPLWQTLPKKGTVPLQWNAFASTIYKNYAYIFGGVNDTDAGPVFSDNLYSFDVNSKIWTLEDIQGDRPPPRMKGIMFSSKTSIYIYGGYRENKSEEVYYNDLWKMNVKNKETRRWECLFKDEEDFLWQGEVESEDLASEEVERDSEENSEEYSSSENYYSDEEKDIGESSQSHDSAQEEIVYLKKQLEEEHLDMERNETLKLYYNRHQEDFLRTALLKCVDVENEKEVKTLAFKIAREKHEYLATIHRRLEHLQKKHNIDLRL